MTRCLTPTSEVADLLLTTLRVRDHVDITSLRQRWAALDPAGLAALTEYEGSVLWLDRRLREFHLPPLVNGRTVNVELHTSTSSYLPAGLAWRRFDTSAQVASCRGGPTRVPAATELLWHAVTQAPLPNPDAFRIRFFQDVAVSWAVGPDIDWGGIASRLASAELPNGAAARRWLGTAARLAGVPDAENPLGPLPALDLLRAMSW